MNETQCTTDAVRVGPYTGLLDTVCRNPGARAQLATLSELLQSTRVIVLTEGRNRNVLLSLGAECAVPPLVVKAFGRQSAVKDAVDRRQGSKACRTWRAARYLAARDVGTPKPLGYLERWEKGRLLESYYLSQYAAAATSFHRELVRLFRNDPRCAEFMALLETVARAIRGLHDAGLQHNDLGNQNILLRHAGGAAWTDVQFIDLNRSRIHARLSDRRRARDISRLNLPSDFLRVFCEMYWGAEPPPPGFLKWERFYRRRYALHCATRAWRHPLRAELESDIDERFPPPRDLWVWDDRSGQAVNAWASAERRRLQSPARPFRLAGAAVSGLPGVWRAYRELRASAFAAETPMQGRIGVAIEPAPDDLDRQLALLARLGNPPVRLRFYHHEPESGWAFRCRVVSELGERGIPVSIAMVQDRRAVTDPARWERFLSTVFERVEGQVEFAEIAHAINRVKWGIWDVAEYRSLLEGAARVKQRFPSLPVTGPAVIDFEYPFVRDALRQLPAGMRFDALSHLLYVDRRGAPENGQGPFTALEKFALARAIARTAPGCGDRLIVSEVNWPLAGQGVYSPVGSPYVSPGPRFNDPSVDEDTYADYMLRYLLLAFCSGLVDRVYWWRLVARGYGLVDDTGADWRLRPAFHMLEQMLAVLRGAVFEPAAAPVAWPPDVRAFTFRLPGARRVTLAYLPHGAREVEAPFNVAEVRDAFGGLLADADKPCRLTGRPVYMWHA